MDARLDFGALAPAAADLAEIGAPFRVEQVEGGLAGLSVLTLAVSFAVALVALPWNVPFLERRSPFGIGRLGRGSTLMLRAMTMINRLTADSADRNMPATFR